MGVGDDVKVYSSKDVSLEFSLNVKALYGQLPRTRSGYVENEIFIAARLISDEEPLTSEVSTTMVSHADGLADWKEKLSFPIKVRDLPRGTVLELKLLSARKFPNTVLGRANVQVFTKDDTLIQGLQMMTLVTSNASSFEYAYPNATYTEQRSELQHLENLLVEYEQGHLPPVNWLDNLVFSRIRDIRKTQLSIAQSTDNAVQLLLELPVFSLPVMFLTERTDKPPQTYGSQRWQQLTWLVDDEVNFIMDNPAERKHQKLQRSVGRGVVDMELKPDGKEKRRLSDIIQLPPTRVLDMEAQNLLWKFRFAIRYDSRALTKFLKCVDWSDPAEAKTAVQLMLEWAPIGPATALELLTPSFTNSDVRRYAVTILAQVDDEELLLYLLQLVQALRYEKDDHSELAKFLVERAIENPVISNYLYWYLQVGWDGLAAERSVSCLRLFERASRSMNARGQSQWDTLKFQHDLMEKITSITNELTGLRTVARKVERLREMLSSDNSLGAVLSSFPLAIPNPLNPTIFTSGIVASESTVFKSALSPLKLSFKTLTGDYATMIFKKGDDLRQDQLCVQMISLMDRLLKRENLDLKLTSYRVLATGNDTGLIEFIKSKALADILKEHDKLTSYIALHNPDPQAPNGCTAESMQNFVKSCAGYSVMTYLLGVGDRHLDNLMLSPDGRLFHIDFGFIMGRDPKISPPSMKLSKEMVEAMGDDFSVFKTYCCEAYNILRKSESVVLLLNLFSLMAHANIPDININQDYEKSLLRFESKFALHLDDEAAMQHFNSEIHSSINALLDPIFERVHRAAQYLR